jgi:hypothetical protein
MHEEMHHKVNAIHSLKKMKLKEGLNVIATAPSGYKLAVELKKGQVPVWIAIDPSGKHLETTARKETVAETTTCWRCVKDSTGHINCFEIPCPHNLTPWPGTDTLYGEAYA